VTRARGWWLWEAPEGSPYRIAVSEEVWERLREAADESRRAAAEVGGFLVGTITACPGGFTIRVEALLPGTNRIGTRDEFTLRAEDFISVQAQGLAPGKEAREGVRLAFEKSDHALEPGEATFGPVIVGWYHTHPGHGVFYSDPDQETHRERFAWPFQVGLVIDPEQEKAGFFTWASSERDEHGDWFGQTLSATRLGQVKGAFHPWKREAPATGRQPLPARLAEVTLASVLAGMGLLVLGGSLVSFFRDSGDPVAIHAPLKKQPGRGNLVPEAFAVPLERQDRHVSIDSGTTRPERLGTDLDAVAWLESGSPVSSKHLALTEAGGTRTLIVPHEVVRLLQGTRQQTLRLWIGPDDRTVERVWVLPGVGEELPFPANGPYVSDDTGWYAVESGQRVEDLGAALPGLYQEIGVDERGRLVAARRWEVIR